MSTTHRPPLLSRRYPWYSFLLDTELTPGPLVRPEGLSQRKIIVTTTGIEHSTFRFVAQCLSQLRHDVPCGKVSFFSTGEQPLVGQGLLIIEASQSYSDTPHLLRLLWTSNQPNESLLPDNTQHLQETDIHAHGGVRTRNPCK
jgi:hypothetical protein